jgi:hypothetical protein
MWRKNYSNHAIIRTMSLWKRPPSEMCMSQHTHYAGGIKIVTLHKFTMEPTKEYINKDSTSQESKYIQRSKSYIKQNRTLPRPSRKGNLANVVASMYLSSNLLRRISETSSNKYEVLSKTLKHIKRSQQVAFVREVRRQARETQNDVSYMVGLSGSEQALKDL